MASLPSSATPARINRTKDPLKPKSAYLVVKTKYGLDGSYETFKRVAGAAGLNRPERRRMIRIELPPGLETQIDYGRVGTIVEGGINRVVWAFCGLLTHSRLPYVEFVRTRTSRASPGASARCGTSTAAAPSSSRRTT